MADEEEEIPADPDDPWAWVSVSSPAKRPADPLDLPAWVSVTRRTETPAETPRDAPAALAEVATAKPVAKPASERRRRRRMRRVGALVIVAGALGVSGYFGGTCVCTHVQQNQPGDALAAASPLVRTTEDTVAEEDSFPTQSTPESAGDAAEAESRAQLAAFKAAADTFAATAASGEPIGRILIPKIGVDVAMVESVDKSFLKEGPGHWPETPFPGQVGNFVVSGHRTTYGAPFFKLNELEAGDQIELDMPYAVALYTVTRVVIVYPDEVDEVRGLGREQVSLVACHPIGSAKQRIVVQGDLISFLLTDQ